MANSEFKLTYTPSGMWAVPSISVSVCCSQNQPRFLNDESTVLMRIQALARAPIRFQALTRAQDQDQGQAQDQGQDQGQAPAQAPAPASAPAPAPASAPAPVQDQDQDQDSVRWSVTVFNFAVIEKKSDTQYADLDKLAMDFIHRNAFHIGPLHGIKKCINNTINYLRQSGNNSINDLKRQVLQRIAIPADDEKYVLAFQFYKDCKLVVGCCECNYLQFLCDKFNAFFLKEMCLNEPEEYKEYAMNILKKMIQIKLENPLPSRFCIEFAIYVPK